MSAIADPAAPSDATLLARIAAGDAHAFALLMHRHAPRLQNRILARVGAADAEDIAQEAMLRVWRAAHRFDAGKGSARAWLDRIALNLAIDHHRRAPPAPIAFGDDLPAIEANALDRLLAREERTRLHRGLAALPAGQRAAVAQRYSERRQGIAAQGRAQEGLLYRARAFLRGFLDEAA